MSPLNAGISLCVWIFPFRKRNVNEFPTNFPYIEANEQSGPVLGMSEWRVSLKWRTSLIIYVSNCRSAWRLAPTEPLTTPTIDGPSDRGDSVVASSRGDCAVGGGCAGGYQLRQCSRHQRCNLTLKVQRNTSGLFVHPLTIGQWNTHWPTVHQLQWLITLFFLFLPPLQTTLWCVAGVSIFGVFTVISCWLRKCRWVT